jgi:hypothetical protein
MFEQDLDTLFALPLSEFVAARKALAAKLKKSGLNDDAANVGALPKPPVTAWAVNQLYRQHRQEFERLLEAGERLRQAQVAQLQGKNADVRSLQAPRREMLSELSKLASKLLEDHGHNPSSDTLRRISTTLEALSIYGSLPDAPRAGRLTADVDPPGFESFAQLVPVVPERTKVVPFRTPPPKKTGEQDIAQATAALREAERVLAATQAKAQEALAVQQKAVANKQQTEKQKQDAKQRLEQAIAADKEAREQERTASIEADKIAKSLEDAMRAVDAARKRLDSLK